jgi:hypothetical protein
MEERYKMAEVINEKEMAIRLRGKKLQGKELERKRERKKKRERER